MVINNELAVSTDTLPVSQAVPELFTAEIVEGRYLAKLAQTEAEIESVLRLRYRVFKVELGASGDDSENELDRDVYDAICRHLIVVDRVSGETVGTYRLNTLETAHNVEGFYAYHEFSLENLPFDILRQSVEIGRACVAREHRNSKVLFLLWKVLLQYLKSAGKRYFFGCCSIFTQDCALGARVFQQFERDGFVHPEIKVEPRWERSFPVDEIYPETAPIELPSLFNMYLKVGVKICGAPAIDREFGTIDFFVLFDLPEMSRKYQKLFFRNQPATRQIRSPEGI